MDFYQQQRQEIPPMASGLTRYRSAPSSYFASILNTTDTRGGGGSESGGGGGFGADDFAKLFNPRASSPEIFARFMNGTVSIQDNSSQLNNPQSSPPRKKLASSEKPPRPQSTDYSSQMIHTSASESSSIRLLDSIKTEGAAASGGNYSLARHNSSPAGLFDATINIETSVGQLGEDRGNDSNYIPEFPMSPWDDSTMLSDDFIKGLTEDDSETFLKSNAALDVQKNEVGNRPLIPLSHHLSLPKSALEKLVQDSVPCKFRAKRGHATHPRSIAERVRRNKISDRTRKLQELVPNMDKQTNTADMLDLAVDYIKDLQRQVKMLSDNRAKCICSARMGP